PASYPRAIRRPRHRSRPRRQRRNILPARHNPHRSARRRYNPQIAPRHRHRELLPPHKSAQMSIRPPHRQRQHPPPAPTAAPHPPSPTTPASRHTPTNPPANFRPNIQINISYLPSIETLCYNRLITSSSDYITHPSPCPPATQEVNVHTRRGRSPCLP